MRTLAGPPPRRRASDRSIDSVYWRVWFAGAAAGAVVGFFGAFLLL